MKGSTDTVGLKNGNVASNSRGKEFSLHLEKPLTAAAASFACSAFDLNMYWKCKGFGAILYILYN